MKRILSFILALVMLVGSLPAEALGAEVLHEHNDPAVVTPPTSTVCSKTQSEPVWEIGTIASANGENKGGSTRMRTASYLLLKDFAGVTINEGYHMTNFVYDENHTYLGTSSWLGSGIPFSTAELQEKYPTGMYFRVVFCRDDQKTLSEESVADSGVRFYWNGEEMPKPNYGFEYEDVAQIGTWQDGAIWDGKLFVLDATGKGAVFDAQTGNKLSGLVLDKKDVLKPHANSVCFGSTYYAQGDQYPLLYVNIYNNYVDAEDRMEGTCCVYRILEAAGGYKTELVQVIRIGFTEDLSLWKSKENNGDVRPYGNFVVDTYNHKLYAFVMRDAVKSIRFFGFDLPELNDGVYVENFGCNLVTLNAGDIKTQFDTDHYHFLQGCCYYRGMILSAEDYSSKAPLSVIDLRNQCVRKTLYLSHAGLKSEPEVLCVDPDSGILYYAAADGILRILTLNDVHFHSYETEVTAPTCTEQGYTTYTCACGDSYVADFVDALGYYHETADVLEDGAQLTLTELNIIKHNKHLIFSAHVEDLGQGIIRISYGQSSYSGSYIEITDTQLIAYSVYKNVTSKSYDHGLTIDGDVKIRIDMERSNARVTIESASGTFSKYIGMLGCNGEIACSVENVTLTNVDLRWYATGIASDYWFFGDSWFSTTSKSSWTKLMLDDGYLDVLLGGYGGMGAAKGLEQFKELLHFDTPEYAIWALGMNNGDRNGTISSGWLNATERFLALCEEYGITPILCTIPTTPKVNNRLKNAWIEDSGHRYIDFDLAVVENHITGEWFAGTAAPDLNHPSEQGAKLLYPQVFADFPELARAVSADCTHKIHTLDAREPDCANGGRRAYYVCSLCACAFADAECTIVTTTEENLLPPLDHTYTAAVTAPTCTAQGYTTYTCACGDSYVADFVDELGHDMGQWTVVKAPSCTTDGSERRDCSRCDHSETRAIAAAGHEYHSVVTEPTCTAQGYTTHICHCGDSYADTYVDALGHDMGQWFVVIAATCTEDGQEARECSRCEHDETRIVTASGHSYEAHVTAPTCTEAGCTTYICSGCEDSYVSDYVPPTGHDHKAVVTAPTCTEKGYTTYICHCGDSYVRDYTGATGHDMGTWETVTEATCTEAGEKIRACSRCDYSETRAIAPTGHDYESVVTEPTCTEQGYTTHTCHCGDSYITSYTNRLGHSFTNYVSDGNASCTQDGTKTAVCDRCDATDTQIDVGSAHGHDFSDWAVVQKPTEEAEGLESRYCRHCGLEETRTIAVVVNPFTDVSAGSFFYEPVLWAVENGITNGTTASTFGPADQCMRAQVVTFLWRAVGCPEPTGANNPFVDVKPTDFYYKAVMWALENGITSGMDATHFGPFAYCNRAQVVTFLWRAMGCPEPESTTNDFTDVASGAFYEKAVLWAVENGITNGLSANAFGPTAICNRAQIVTFLYRTYN